MRLFEIIEEMTALLKEAQTLVSQENYEVSEKWIQKEAKALEEDRAVRETEKL